MARQWPSDRVNTGELPIAPAPVPEQAGDLPLPLRLLRRWLLVGNLLITVLVVLLALVALGASHAAFKRNALEATHNLAQTMQLSIGAEVSRIDLALQLMVQEHADSLRNPGADLPSAMLRHRALLGDKHRLALADGVGRAWPGLPVIADLPMDLGQSPFFEATRDAPGRELIISEPTLMPLSQTWAIVLSRRLESADGRFAGVVFATMSSDHFRRMFTAAQLGPNGYIALRSASLRLVAHHSRQQDEGPGIGSSNVSPQLREAVAMQPDAGSYVGRVPLDAIERASAYRQVGTYPLIVVTGLATSDYLASWWTELGFVSALAVLVVLVMGMASWLMLRTWRMNDAVNASLARDMVARRQAEEALRASEDFLDRTGRVAGVGGWELDLATNTLHWSDQTCRIHDLQPGYLPALPQAMRFFSPDARERLEMAIQDGLRHGGPWDLELPMTTANGRAVWVRSFGEAEFDGDRPVRLIGALQDITEQRERRNELKREQALRAQVEHHAVELDKLLHERSDMLDVMAHEVRQPLNNASAALQSAATALAEAGETAAASRLKRAQLVLGQVMASIDNNLAVASLLARSKPIERMDTDIDTLVAMAIADMPAAERRRVQVERLTPTRTASMDMGLMRLALRNLLANALKYSPPGTPVRVTLSDSDEPLALLIDVTDAGPGVDADLVPRLFERGTRGASVGQAPGHGLGLYIVRRVMEMHGGSVELVHNEPGQATLRLVVEQAPLV